MRSWEEAVKFAFTLPGVELGTSYGQPAVKCSTSGRAFMSTGREAASAFCLHLDLDRVDMLIETDPETFFQTPHYVGWPTVLVRYGSADPARVAAMIEQALAYAAARPKLKARKVR